MDTPAAGQSFAKRTLLHIKRCLAGSSRSVLDAFFYGKAFAEVANEKLGVVADELLLEFNKRDAKRRRAFRCSIYIHSPQHKDVCVLVLA